MIEPIKIKFYRIKNIVLMDIIKQDKNFIPLKNKLFVASNGIGIHSIHYPQLTSRSIYLQGDDSINNERVAYYPLPTEEDAILYMEKITQAASEFKSHIIMESTSNLKMIDDDNIITITV